MSNPTFFVVVLPRSSADPLEGKLASDRPSAETSGAQTTPLRTYAGMFWFAEVPGYEDRVRARRGYHVLSTEEIAVLIDSGYGAKAINGPFGTRDEAERSFERYWEMILDHDDD